MPLQSTLPIDIKDVYDFAVANGYTQGYDLATLISWSGWSNLPAGANSLADFLGADAYALNNVFELNLSDYRCQNGNVRCLKISDTEFIMLRGYVYNADRELGISFHTLTNNGQTIDTPSNNYTLIDNLIINYTEAVDICLLSSSGNTHTFIAASLSTGDSLLLRKMQLDTSTVTFSVITQYEIDLPANSSNPRGFRIWLHSDGRLMAFGGFGLFFIDTNLTSGSLVADLDGSFTTAIRLSSAFDGDYIYTAKTISGSTYARVYEVAANQNAQLKDEVVIAAETTTFTNTLPLKNGYFVVFYGVNVDPGKNQGYYRLMKYDSTTGNVSLVGPSGIYYDVESSPTNDTIGSTRSTYYDDINDYVIVYSYTNYDSIYFQMFQVDFLSGVLNQVEDYRLFPRSYPSSEFLKMINGSLVWSVDNNGGNSKYDDDSYLTGILEVNI